MEETIEAPCDDCGLIRRLVWDGEEGLCWECRMGGVSDNE